MNCSFVRKVLHLSRRRRYVVCGCLVLVFNCNVCNICHRVQVTPVWVPWNNWKEVPRWEVVEIQKMSPPTTGRCSRHAAAMLSNKGVPQFWEMWHFFYRLTYISKMCTIT